MKDVFSWIFCLKTSKLADFFGSPTKTIDLEILRYACQRWTRGDFLGQTGNREDFPNFSKKNETFFEVFICGESYSS